MTVDGAGDFRVPLQFRRAVHQHVGPGLDGPLVVGARHHEGGVAAQAAASGRGRVQGVVGVDVRRLVARRVHAERPVAVEGVGLPAAMQVEVGGLRPLQGPRILHPPPVFSHDEDAHRLFVGHAVVLSLEPVVVVAEDDPGQVQDCRRCAGAEVELARNVNGRIAVNPGADE